MITWRYNRFGHVELWNNEMIIPGYTDIESDLYLQSNDDVNAFLEQIGLSQDYIYIDDWDRCEDPGYF